MTTEKKNLDSKVCKICLKDLNKDSTKPADIAQSNYICTTCRKDYYKQRYLEKKEIIREQQRNYDLNNKREVIKGYGGKCSCCEETHLEFLTVYSKNKKPSGGKLYRWLIKNNFPKEDYMLFCFNCSYSLKLFGYCPHSSQLAEDCAHDKID